MSWSAISSADWKRDAGSALRRLQQELVERFVATEERHLAGRGEAGGVTLLVLEAGEVEAEHGEGAADRVEVGADGGPDLGDLGRLVADRPVQVAVIVVDGPHATQVDQRQMLVGLDGVVRLEVAVEQALVVQVAERGQYGQHVGDGLFERQRRSGLAPWCASRSSRSDSPPTYSMTM